MSHARAVIFANGILPDPQAARGLLREGDLWIAADGGSRHALAFGRAPDVVIGDLDSLPDPVRAIPLFAPERFFNPSPPRRMKRISNSRCNTRSGKDVPAS